MAERPPSGRSGRGWARPPGLALLGLAVVGYAARRPWAQTEQQGLVSGDSGPGFTSVLEVAMSSGTSPAALLAAVLGIAAWVAALLLRGVARRWAARVAAAVPVGLLAFVVAEAWRAPDRVRRSAEEVLSALPTDVSGEASLTGWYWAAVAGAVLALVASAVAVRRVAGWPELSARYERTAAAETRAAVPQQDDHSIWKALSEGRDPTA